MNYSRILGTGSYLPSHIMTNEDWEKRVDTTSQWIVERTGIESRHIAKNETTADMAAKAAENALNAAQIEINQIDLIIVSTGTSDKVFPATACLVQKKLNIPTCIAFDVQAACSGFIYALSIADQFIKTGAAKHALVIGSEMMSRLIDWTDRATCVLFGDGAGAVLLGQHSQPGILATKLYAEATHADILKVDNIQMANFSHLLGHPTDNASLPLSQFSPYLYMEGQKVFKLAVNTFDQMVEDMEQLTGRLRAEIDWLVPHQANIRIIKAAADKLGLSMDKVVYTAKTQGNTSSASIPLALDTAIRDGRIKRGQKLMLKAFGGGLTWGSALIQY